MLTFTLLYLTRFLLVSQCALRQLHNARYWEKVPTVIQCRINGAKVHSDLFFFADMLMYGVGSLATQP
jgi:hypothetical protein